MESPYRYELNMQMISLIMWCYLMCLAKAPA
jgi:hypothetical protein